MTVLMNGPMSGDRSPRRQIRRTSIEGVWLVRPRYVTPRMLSRRATSLGTSAIPTPDATAAQHVGLLEHTPRHELGERRLDPWGNAHPEPPRGDDGSLWWPAYRDASTPAGAGELVAGGHPGRKLGAVLQLELPKDGRDVSLDRLARQEQRARDVRIAGAARDELRDLELAVAQGRDVSARSCARPASPGADAHLTQQLIDV